MTEELELLKRRVEELEDARIHKCHNCTCPDFTLPTRALERMKADIRMIIQQHSPLDAIPEGSAFDKIVKRMETDL